MFDTAVTKPGPRRTPVHQRQTLRLTPIASSAFTIALILSFCTYITDSDKLALYAAALAALIFAAISAGLSFKGAEHVRSLIILYCGFAATSVLVNLVSAPTLPLEALIYPIVAVLIAGSLWKVFYIGTGGALSVFSLFGLNALVAALPIFGVRSAPLIGDIELGRYIFFTDLPSAAGLLWNVNYYAVAQGTGFWFAMVQLARGTLPRWSRWLVYGLGASVLLGSSRSATLALAFTVIIYLSAIYTGLKIRALTTCLAALVTVAFLDDLYLQIYLDDALNEGLRLYRGLNSRDELWAAGLQAALASPLTGYGNTDTIKDVLRGLGSPTTTVQNAFLTVQLLYGVGAFLVLTALSILALSRFLTHQLDRVSAAVYALFLFIFIDAFVRSYVLGGVGLMPFMLFASCTFLLRIRPSNTRQ